MQITDLRAISEWAHAKNLKVIVDNTFLTPYFQKPLLLGADIVLHSGTKYLGGHNDLLAGILVTKEEEDTAKIKFLQNTIGAVLSPFDSWLLLRGLKTLPLRMERHAASALRIAKWLKQQPRRVRSVCPQRTLKTEAGSVCGKSGRNGIPADLSAATDPFRCTP